ncbi:MAG: hypothetical protein ABSG35_09750 [Syntrophobacteraceae bacterium]|jgi:hypothetical protein
MAIEKSSIPVVQGVSGEHNERKGVHMANEQSKLADELKTMQFEPLLPVEKKLIGWSIALGIVLLGILVWVSYTFFPGNH